MDIISVYFLLFIAFHFYNTKKKISSLLQPFGCEYMAITIESRKTTQINSDLKKAERQRMNRKIHECNDWWLEKWNPSKIKISYIRFADEW